MAEHIDVWTEEVIRMMAYGDVPDEMGLSFVDSEIVTHTRWGTLVLNVYRRDSDGKLFGGIGEHASGDGETQTDDLPDEYWEMEEVPTITYRFKKDNND